VQMKIHSYGRSSFLISVPVMIFFLNLILFDLF